MRTKIRQRCDFYDWPTNIRKRLWALTLRESSGMRDMLKYNRQDIHQTFVLFEGDTPVAWALACWDDSEYDFMFYTRRDKRRKGYGRRLHKKLIDWVGNDPYAVFIAPDNSAFFSKVGEI